MSRYAGEFEHVFEASTAGVTLQAPQLDINTVAAGGGSRLFFRSVPVCSYNLSDFFLSSTPLIPVLYPPRSGLFVVGPESAGAHPGPACYRKGKSEPLPCWASPHGVLGPSLLLASELNL